MLQFFKDLWWYLGYPWPKSALRKLRALKISVCPAERLPECLGLYERNIPHGLPADHLEEYADVIYGGKQLVLLVEDGDKLLATFTLARYARGNQISLAYVLVDPVHHRSGVGTTMIFATIAMLSGENRNAILGITALPTSAAFYKKLGFSKVGRIKIDNGQSVGLFSVFIWSGVSCDCLRWLNEAGVRLDANGGMIPVIEPPKRESETLDSGNS
ncbi:GNAT family N-acetyltransferase [Roseimicrobium sp. ORNL1]|uniref:GNAT family N-acetyltransferase n=1 Tax=Roseimicrobium sp. ORNL1 TaxID=2711231 RepID=UPI0013E10CF7|nr:GNAT family N-acetyltransferase [Roseimicrobium sp. ORNL1]QIF00390.1 GNAT family N-acetyltransferase [Roseimicrobium sp. ORNL1]